MPPNMRQSGNVFFALFGAVALVGVVGASVTTILKGPVAGMQRVTKYTVAENNMIAAGKLALIAATNQPLSGDCDGDDMVEPIPYSTTGDGPFPTGGGYLPAEIGATRQDPWGNIYGYCVWDHGIDPDDPADNNGECGGSTNFRAGADSEQYIALAVISSGPDRIFQSSCNDFDPENPDAPLVVKSAGSDDVVLAYTYAEAGSMSGGLWKLKSGDSSTAEVGNRNVEIAGSGGGDAARIGYDEGLEMSGVGEFLAIKTDHIFSRTSSGEVNMESPLRVKLMDELEKPMGVAGEGVGTKSVIAPALRRNTPTMPIAPDGQDWADAIICPNIATGGTVFFLHGYNSAAASNNQVVYRHEHTGTDYLTHYNELTGAQGSTGGHGNTCPANYSSAIKVYYGSGGGGNVPSILPGWPDALRCGTFDGSGVGSILYLEGSASGHFRYTRPYSHAASGGTGSYSLTFSPDGSYHGEGGGADTMYANCKNKSITTLVEEGKGIFFGGGTGGGAGTGGGSSSESVIAPKYREVNPGMPMAPDGKDWADALICGGNSLYLFNIYKDAEAELNVAYSYISTSTTSDRYAYYHKTTGARTQNSGSSCPDNYANAVKVYFGSGSGDSTGGLTSKAGLDGSIWPDALICTEADSTNRAFTFAAYDGTQVVYSFNTSDGNITRLRYNSETGAFNSFSASGSHSLDDLIISTDPCRSSVHDVVAAGKSANYGGSGDGAASTMVPNWPDAIICKGSGGSDGIRPLFLSFQSTAGATYRRITNGSDNLLSFDASGNYGSHTSMSGYDCVANTMSISALYAVNQAFKFVGGGSGGSGGGGTTVAFSVEGLAVYSGGTMRSFTNTLVNTGGAYNNTTGIFTAPKAGTYVFHGAVLPQSGGTNHLIIQKNGSELNASYSHTAEFGQLSVHAVASLDVGDEVRMVFQGGTLHTNNWDSFSGYLLEGGGSGGSGESLWTESGGNVYRSSGNVGIGTASPFAKLQVHGPLVSNATEPGEALWSLSKGNVAGQGGLVHTQYRPDQAVSAYGGFKEWTQGTGTSASASYYLGHIPNLTNIDNVNALLTVLASGRVGIGTTSPSTLLNVSGPPASSLGQISIQGAHTGDSNAAYLSFRASNGTRIGYVGDGSSGNSDIYLLSDSGNVRAQGIGGGCVINTGGCTSDIRLKQNVKPVTSALDKLMKISGVSYEWKAAPGSKYMGFIAQEVEAQFPILVETDEEGIKSVNYNGMGAPIVEAIKELKGMFDDLTAKVAALFTETTGLKETDIALEAEIVELRAANDTLRADNDRLSEELTDINKRLQKLEAAQ